MVTGAGLHSKCTIKNGTKLKLSANIHIYNVGNQEKYKSNSRWSGLVKLLVEDAAFMHSGQQTSNFANNF